MIADLDTALAKLNDRRTAAIIRASTDYEKYKYVIIGSQLCAGAHSVFSSLPKFKFTDWIPAADLARHTSSATLSQIVAASQSPGTTLQNEFKSTGEQSDATAKKMEQDIPRLAKGEMPEFKHLNDLNACPVKNVSTFERVDDTISPPAKTGNDLADRYAIDTVIRAGQPRQQLAFLRFLLEGRGIDIGDISMQAQSHEYQRDPGDIAILLMEKEPSLAALHKRLLQAKVYIAIKPTSGTSEAESKNQDLATVEACDKLRNFSIEAFSKGATTTPPSSKTLVK